jgi:hypothetical protein
MQRVLYKFRFVFAALFVFADILLLSLVPSVLKPISTEPSANVVANQTTNMYDGPNAVTGAVTGIASGLGGVANKTGELCVSGVRSAGFGALHVRRFTFASIKVSANFAISIIVNVGRGIGSGIMFTSRVAMGAVTFVGNIAGSGLLFTFRIPGNIMGFFINNTAAGSIIRPAHASAMPVIDTSAKVKSLEPVNKKLPAVIAPAPAIDNTQAEWPIHGAITTMFGVPHWPWQPTHTGLDISDGQRSGVTPIHPYKPGRVAEVIQSRQGLGNHVVVDHGNGLTSVYGHMYSTNVQPGQDVDKNSVLGYEGSTGASTGTHLHFEININGQPVDPMQYVSGKP